MSPATPIITLGAPLIELSEIDSTNMYAMEQIHAQKALSGSVYQTDFQTNGKGQHGRIWESQRGENLLCTYILELNTLKKGKNWVPTEQVGLSAAVALGAQALLAGSVDVITVPIGAQAAAVSKGADFVAISLLVGTSGGILAIGNSIDLSGADDLTSRMKRLEGKKVGVSARGTAGEFAVKFMLKSAGLEEDAVTFVAVGGLPTAIPALTGGQVDAVLAIEPLGAICEVLAMCQVAWAGVSATEPAPLIADRGASNPAIVRKSWLDDNAEVAAAFRDAIVAASDFVQNPENYDEVVAIVSETVKFDLPKSDEILAQTIKNMLPFYKASIDMAAAERAMDLAEPLYGAKRRVELSEIIMPDAPQH